jgi:hypothetical protein
VNTYHFHTIHDGIMRTYPIMGDSIRDAVTTLRSALYDGETIVGWA